MDRSVVEAAWLVTRALVGSTVMDMRSIRLLVAVVLAGHGLIHLIGFVVPWRLATFEGFAYRTTAMGGTLELGDGGARLLGLAWLALAVAFVIAAVGVWRSAAWALPLAGGLAALSLIVCVLGFPETGAGVVVNLALMASVAWLSIRPPRRAAVAA